VTLQAAIQHGDFAYGTGILPVIAARAAIGMAWKAMPTVSKPVPHSDGFRPGRH